MPNYSVVPTFKFIIESPALSGIWTQPLVPVAEEPAPLPTPQNGHNSLTFKSFKAESVEATFLQTFGNTQNNPIILRLPFKDFFYFKLLNFLWTFKKFWFRFFWRFFSSKIFGLKFSVGCCSDVSFATNPLSEFRWIGWTGVRRSKRRPKFFRAFESHREREWLETRSRWPVKIFVSVSEDDSGKKKFRWLHFFRASVVAARLDCTGLFCRTACPLPKTG